ncbi:MAG: class I SAM-dependent methyltransferase [Nitrospirota bacterium]|nr:class I SAM-dependent methyltransferase [Nitrospirota bacterium]
MTPSDTYQLIDSGDGRKLEQVGPHLLVRPAAQAVWRPRLPKGRWKAADAVFVREGEGDMSWTARKPLPDQWAIELAGATFRIKTTGFGHLGLFAEQQGNWAWIREQVKTLAGRTQRPPSVLNMFAYTGGSTLAALAAGAEVTHLDASRGIVDWARENAALSGLADAPCRWMVDDVRKFVQRELRRERVYDGIILDPPSFGRGSKGQVWKIEEHLAPLLADCRALMGAAPGFVLLSAHTPGFSPIALQNMLADAMPEGRMTCGEMTIAEAEGGRLLPSGTWARWSGA